MFKRSAQHRLQALLRELKTWEQSVPERARRFHQMRGQLESQIEEKYQARFGRWMIGDDLVRSFEQRCGRLKPLVEPLAELITLAEDRDRECAQLARRETELGEPDLKVWLKECCRQWSIEMERLGASCERPPDLIPDRARLRTIEDAVRHTDQAVTWLAKARSTLDRLGSSEDTAALESALPDLKEDLRRQGASEEWLQKIRALVQPLQSLVAQSRPVVLDDAGALLTELRKWSREIAGYEQQTKQLTSWHQKLDMDWRKHDPQEMDELKRQAEALHASLTGQARERRSALFQGLQQRMHALVQVCGQQQDIQARLDELEALRVDRCQSHQGWMEKYRRADEYFKDIANTYFVPLNERLEALSEELDAGIRTLRARPLSDEVRQEADNLQYELKQLGSLQDPESVLQALQRSRDFKRQIEHLERQAQHDVEALSNTQTRLTELNNALQANARSIDVEIQDLGAAIAELGSGSRQQSLEQARSLARELEDRVEALEQDFVGRARARLAEQNTAVATACALLRQAGQTVEPPPQLRIDEVTGPDEATAMVVAGNRFYRTLLERMEQLSAELDGYRVQAGTRLARLRPETLGPGDRDDAEQLAAEVEQGSWSESSDTQERVAALAQLKEKCELFFDRLLEEEQTLQERLENLIRNLRAFNEDHLRRYCREPTERVDALVYGIPGTDGHMDRVRQQLDLAERVFRQVQAQARRLAIRDLETNVETLRLQVNNHDDPQFYAKTKALLDELDGLGHDTLPPVTLRMRLQRAASRIHRST